MSVRRNLGLMLFFNMMNSSNFLKPALLLASLFLFGCSHQKKDEAKPLNAVSIKGLFSGQDHYRGWVVFLSRDKMRTKQFPVKDNGNFLMVVPNLKPGNYQFHYGRKGNSIGFNSFQIPVYKQQINLGWVNTQ